MEIINSIVGKWLEEEENIRHIIANLQDKHNNYVNELLVLKSNSSRIVSEHDSKAKDIADIYEFMDFIKVSRDKLPFKAEELDHDIISDNNNKQNIIEVDDNKTKKNIEMYQHYLQIIESVKRRCTNITQLRNVSGYYDSQCELVIDAYILNDIAKSKFKYSQYEEYEYKKYTEAISVFSKENMKKVGHPSNDNVWVNGMADLVVAICRVSWQRDYFTKFVDQYNKYDKTFKHMTRKLLKNERNNPIVGEWLNDNEIINLSSQKNNIFYKQYRQILSVDNEEDINGFIHVL